MGSTISIVIAVVAVVVGFLILRNINDDGGSTASALPQVTQPTTADSTVDNGSTVTTPTTTPIPVTQATNPLVFSPGTVVVANASGASGAAKYATQALANAGWTMGDPTDAFGAEKKITMTKVYYQPGSEQVAASVAQAFSTADNIITSSPMPAAIPVTNATIGNATVLVMLGTDLALKTLPMLSPQSTAVDTTLPTADLPTTVPGG
jgi:hypothetical protein